MRQLITLATAITSIAAMGCGPKAPPVAAADAAASATQAITMEASGEALAFIKAWTATSVTNFTVAAGSGGDVVYGTLDFTPAGTWSASATFSAAGEEFPCTESGDWTVASADSASAATIEWTVTKTTCATRESGTTTRAAITLKKGGEYDISFR